MKPDKEKILINRLWDWLEERFQDVNAKLDHILFRLRKEDPRVYQSCLEYEDEENLEVTE